MTMHSVGVQIAQLHPGWSVHVASLQLPPTVQTQACDLTPVSESAVGANGCLSTVDGWMDGCMDRLHISHVQMHDYGQSLSANSLCFASMFKLTE